MLSSFDTHFKDKIYLISGASSGIGAAIAKELNNIGAKIIALGRNKDRLEILKQEAKFSNNIFIEMLDLADSTSLDKKIFEICKRYNKLDGVVLSAGIQQIAPIKSVLSVEKAKALFEINYFSNMQIAKAFCDRRISNNSSSIVFISSIAAFKGNAGISLYSASKGAINSSIKSLALELASRRIRVNAIAPGFVLTNMIKEWSEIYDEAYISKIDREYPLGIGRVQDVVGVVAFLLSPLSSWITGQVIVADGGGSI